MSECELVKKMLRAILLANKAGVSLSQLQLEYKELTGEQIPHKQMGYNHLEGLLANLPSVVHLEHKRSGEVTYFPSHENPNLAKVVARQRNSKKMGRPHLVNTQMRVKPSAPLVLNAKPQTSLRQPSHRGRGGGRGGGFGGRGAGDFRPSRDARDGQTGTQPNKAQNTGRKSVTPADRPDKRMTLPARFQKEVHAHLSRNLHHTSSPLIKNEGVGPGSAKPYDPQQVQTCIQEILSKYSTGFWVSKLPQIYKELYQQDLPPEALKDLETWTHICTVEKTCSSNQSELLLYPAGSQTTPPSDNLTSNAAPAKPSNPTKTQQGAPSSKVSRPASHPSKSPPPAGSLPPDLQQKLEELLVKYSNGLWAHALPKLFQDTYKTKLPAHVLENLELLSDFCTIDYPMPDNPKRAILYRRSSEGGGKEDVRRDSTTGEEVKQKAEEMQQVPALQIPKEEYPSVLVVEATNTNAVVLRYIGECYSLAQESMEDNMRKFYSLDQKEQKTPVLSPTVGQLVAVRVEEEEEEVLRARVCEVMLDKLQVYYLDHGFSETVHCNKVFQLHEDFLKLPFQATKCSLAGLEPFCQDADVLKKFETMASGRILLAEILQRGQTPLAVLYDTSQDDDVNINAACMKALHDKALASPIQGNSVYTNVMVSSVSSDGTVCCVLPSRGLSKLNQILEKIETYFLSQVTSELLVSRPFCGKTCLARLKGKWSRVEITNLHGSRVLDLLFIDVGVQASVEVIELREIPHLFLRGLMAIPPQAVKCCLEDVTVGVGSWTPESVQWLREKVLHTSDCSLKVSRVDENKNCIYVHLFPDKNFHDPARSLNHQLAQSDLFKQRPDVFLTSHSPVKASALTPASPLSSPSPGSAPLKPLLRKAMSGPKVGGEGVTSIDGSRAPAPHASAPLIVPPLLELPPAGSNMDVYVSVVCHPGHFVLQPWRDMYKLVVLMGEMILYYNKTEESLLSAEKNQIYAAKVENNWYRVLVKGILSNGLVSVYELDYGKHELVSCTQLRVLINEFRQLPFQGITAQLAGVRVQQWSEEASIVFRNHVEKKPLVAQVEAVQEAAHAWDRKLTVYLVDTSQEEQDIWVHDLMAEFSDEM
ncbi:tudor domain-containing protein 7B isoform 1-T1 [Synchiropus picturatus]